MVQSWREDDQQVVQQQRLEVQIKVDGLVVQLHVSHLQRHRKSSHDLQTTPSGDYPSVIYQIFSIFVFRHLGDDVFELALLPGVGRVVHHGDDGIVILLVLVIEEHELCPEVGLLCCPENLMPSHTHKQM